MEKAIVSFLLNLSLLRLDNAWASDFLSISLTPEQTNPPSPQMGNWLKFHSVIKNSGRMAWRRYHRHGLS